MNSVVMIVGLGVLGGIGAFVMTFFTKESFFNEPLNHKEAIIGTGAGVLLGVACGTKIAFNN